MSTNCFREALFKQTLLHIWWVHTRPNYRPTCTSRPKSNQRPNNKRHD